jgi:membrane-associated phospholipid phosphatase
LSSQTGVSCCKFPLSQDGPYLIYPLMAKPITERIVAQPVEAVGSLESGARWYSWVFRLRIEEFLALVFFGPMVYVTARAYFFFKAQGHVPNVFIGDVQRVFGVVVAVAVALLIVKYRPRWTFLRDSLPFAYCVAIYANLHDTIHFVNPNDIHDKLIAIDQWLFGVQPSVWAQQFIHPALTEVFSFCYMIFFVYAPVVALTLYLLGRKAQFRETLVSVILCFYAGYILYVIFPAAPPRIMLKDLYTLTFSGTPIADAAMRMVNLLPSDSRAAFPSLHAAVTLLSLMFAFKYVRTLFWIMLPFCTGLILSTIYLRHHYVIDLIAGFALGIVAFIVAPRIDAWWRSKNPNLARTESHA